MRDPRIPEEWQLHAYVADLLRVKAKRDVLWFYVVNEGKRSARNGAFLKRLGMLPGVADFVIINKWSTHFLELKKPKTGRMSSDQDAFAMAAADVLCPYEVVRTPEDAEAVLLKWGAIK